MCKTTLGFSICLLLAFGAGPGVAQVAPGPTPPLMAEIERAASLLADAHGVQPLIYQQPNGALSISIPLRTELAGGSQAPAAKPVRLLAIGNMVAPPANLAALVKGVLSTIDTPYNFWWVVVNTTSQRLNRRTAIKLSGSGPPLNLPAAFNYPANAVTVTFLDNIDDLQPGLHTFKVKLSGGGTLTTHFLVQP